VRNEFGVAVDRLPWGARVRDPGAMDLIKVEEVTARLDQLFAAIKQEKT
jgi:hypothetical protein